MKYFGENWGAPALKDAPQVQTPCGELCLMCKQPILERDQGVIMPVLTKEGSFERPEHYECFMRNVVGSVGHQLGLCTCNGGPGKMDDPPGMTEREASKAAVAISETLRHAKQLEKVYPSGTKLFELGERIGMLPKTARLSVMDVYLALANGPALHPNSRPLNACDVVVLETLCICWEDSMGLKKN